MPGYGCRMRVALTILMATALCRPAEAGPWARASGEGYGRVAVAGERVSGLDAMRFDGYAEYGLNDQWTLTLKAEQVRFQDNEDFTAEGFRATVRRGLYKRGPLIVAGEIGAVHGAAIGGVRGCDRLGGEFRLTTGMSGGWSGSDWYIFADAATRLHAEGCWRDRLEFGGAQEIVPNLFLTNQFWFERGSKSARSDKVETGLLWRLDEIDLSVAWREELSGRFEESGLVVALASRF